MSLKQLSSKFSIPVGALAVPLAAAVPTGSSAGSLLSASRFTTPIITPPITASAQLLLMLTYIHLPHCNRGIDRSLAGLSLAGLDQLPQSRLVVE